jgi:hypothetical protein
MLRGYRGLVFNILLLGISYLFSNWLIEINMAEADFKMPMYMTLILCGLIPVEHQANLYLLSCELQQMGEDQKVVWNTFTKTWFFGILLLMVLIWRTYFKMEFLIMPLFYEIYEWLGYPYKNLDWKGKIPVYATGSIILYAEAKLIGHTLIPGTTKVFVPKLWIYRFILLLSVTFYTTGLVWVFRRQFMGLNTENIWEHLPMLLIFFVFFYIPLRWVEVIADVTDCVTRWQLWLFWITTFLGMVMVIRMV